MPDIVCTAGNFSIATLDLEQDGRIGVCPLPGRYNPLAEDVETISEWKPSIVLTLTEMSEMKHMGSEQLGPQLEVRGITWKHLPIRDWSGMSDQNAAHWPTRSKQFHCALDGGEGVLIHCRGGQGRSGMIALRLLVERGIEPETALKRLRRVRPGAVETPEQLHWAIQRPS
ncbi:MAG: protein-tyrosine phosphatase family protein [Pseudomonadota bacterium]